MQTRPAAFFRQGRVCCYCLGNIGKAAEQELLVELAGIGNPEDWMIDAAIPQQYGFWNSARLPSSSTKEKQK